MGRASRNAYILAALTAAVSAQNCIPLSGSTHCSAFKAASISTNSNVAGLFPFLSFVSSVETFDQEFARYINSTYVQVKYQTLLGCSNVNLTNTTDYYARYATTVICNAIVQNSIEPCGLSGSATRPLCADDCAQHAISEEQIVANGQLCGTPGPNFAQQIRADFVTCSLPDNALTGDCIPAEQNEPNNCGFSSSLEGLCRFCGTSTQNATDSCCYGSNATGLCAGVTLPTLSPMPNITFSSNNTSTNNTSPNPTSAPSSSNSGLSGGAIAGIVVGSVVGALLLAALIAFCCITYRRRRRSNVYTLNQPSPRRSHAASVSGGLPSSGGRVARMSALEGVSGDEKGPGFFEGHSDQDTPDSKHLGIGPVASRRRGSLSSNSMLGITDDSSPNNQLSSPEGLQSGQSEQLPFFKDYYSTDDIHPGDKVATLWAYQARAGDEFDLGRGDMLKVIGIWDDGWATGIRVDDRAEEYDGKQHKAQRDSGVSNVHRNASSPEPQGDIKAFPLVCVCLPEHWRKTIEGGESSSDSATSPRHLDTRFPNF